MTEIERTYLTKDELIANMRCSAFGILASKAMEEKDMCTGMCHECPYNERF